MFTPEQIAKLKSLINDGVQIKREVEDLNGGLKDTVSAIAEELEIKPAVLNKAITKAFKGDFERDQTDLEAVEEILDVTGNKVP
jgi:ABC-type iron transport system FetAB ATPase subunit